MDHIEQIEKRYYKLKNEVEELEERLETLKSLDLAEDWGVITGPANGKAIVRIPKTERKGFKTLPGVGFADIWSEEIHLKGRNITPAPVNVVERKIKEAARKKGFSQGTYYIGVNGTYHVHQIQGELKYYPRTDQLTDGFGDSVYLEGEWGTPAPNIKINGYKPRFKMNGNFKLSCKEVTVDDILDANRLIEKFGVNITRQSRELSLKINELAEFYESLNR